jgi:redox-sensitive bicupin YhaK (pirin superfamily)
MDMIRKVSRAFTGKPTMEGAGVKLKRIFGHSQIPLFDPFLMMDVFGSDNPDDYMKGFPWHPHRGIETVTYIISGAVEHGDSMGNKGVITDGQCQWMTAGSGIIHQEMPENKGRLRGIQLWVNLPAKNKMLHPFYQDIKCEEIPESSDENGSVRILAGTYEGIEGPVKGISIKPVFLDVVLNPGKTFEYAMEQDDTVFAYVLEGAGMFAGDTSISYDAGNAVLFEKGETVGVESGKEGMRFILVIGKPIGEPIAWGGPIVMNTEEELEKAFDELDSGTFIKHK